MSREFFLQIHNYLNLLQRRVVSYFVGFSVQRLCFDQLIDLNKCIINFFGVSMRGSGEGFLFCSLLGMDLFHFVSKSQQLDNSHHFSEPQDEERILHFNF